MHPPPGVEARAVPESTSDPFYMQEGFTLAEENGSASTVLPPSVSAQFVLRASPYATGYELNGLTTTGDWIQVLASSNWPGGSLCPSGFNFYYELWNNQGASVVGPVCVLDLNATLYPSSGDLLRVSMSLNCASGGSGTVCMTFQDLTTGYSTTIAQPQPDPTATGFQNLAGPANPNGYFTGPMTEVVDTSTSLCLAYPLPTVVYQLENSFVVTEYVPWSDEFSVRGTLCYVHAGSPSVLTDTPLTQFYEATGGSSYGPHYEGAQNGSAVSGTPGSSIFETDVPPLDFAVALSPGAADVGQTVTLTGEATGGRSPYSCAWFVDGAAVVGVTSCSWEYDPTAAGTVNLSGYGIDALGNYAVGWASLSVSPPLVLEAPTANRSSVDVGQAVQFAVAASGGSGGFVYDWSGLPPGCSGVGALVPCAPTSSVPGTVVGVTVTDSNGMSVASGGLPFTVFDPPTVGRPVADVPSADVGQQVTFSATTTPGSGGLRYTWVGLPYGCGAGSNPVACTTTAAGTYLVSLQVTDSNGYIVTSPSLPFTVSGGPTVTAPVATPSSVREGESVTFSVSASSGAGGITYRWSGLPPGCSAADEPIVTCAPTASGTYTVTVTVTDSDGGEATSPSLAFHVDRAAGGLSVDTGYLLLGAVLGAAAVGAAVAVALRWRRRGGSTEGRRPDAPTPPARAPPSGPDAGRGG